MVRRRIFHVLNEFESSEGGMPVGIYSSPEKAREAAAERPLSPPFYYTVHPLKLDAPPDGGADYSELRE